MITPIKMVSGPVGKGRSRSIVEFPKCPPDQIMRIEIPPEIFLSQASWQITLPASQSI